MSVIWKKHLLKVFGPHLGKWQFGIVYEEEHGDLYGSQIFMELTID